MTLCDAVYFYLNYIQTVVVRMLSIYLGGSAAVKAADAYDSDSEDCYL